MRRSGRMLVVGSLLLGACTPGAPYRGPMPVRNQHPAQLTVLHLPPGPAAVVPEGEVHARLDTAHTSLFLGESRPGGDSFVMDGEVLRTSLAAHAGLGHGLQLDLELPVAHVGGGFLDDFVIQWHEAFGFPEQGRKSAPRDRLLIRAERRNQRVFEVGGENLTLLDVPVGVTWELLRPGRDQPWGFAARAGLELPTGNEDRGYGNGEPDTALGLVGEWRGRTLAVSGWLQHTFAGTPDRARAAGISFRDVTAGGMGVEVPLGRDTSALVQTGIESSTLRALDLDATSDVHWLLWTGVRQRLWRDLHLEVALGEDLAEFVGPDFSVWLGLSWFP